MNLGARNICAGFPTRAGRRSVRPDMIDHTSPIRDFMTPAPVTIGRALCLSDAARRMHEHHIGHLPVLEEGRVVGLVSQRDLLAAALTKALDFEPAQRRTFLRSVEVAEVMAKDVATVGPDATLAEAARILVGRRIGKDIVQVGQFPDGTPIRWMFTEITQDSFRWTGEALDTDGKSWKLQGDFRATRRR